MKIVELLAKITYWNSLIYSPIKTISWKSVNRKIYNQKYLFVYFIKEESNIDENRIFPNTQLINLHLYETCKNVFNKKQKIIILNNKHEIAAIYRDLIKEKHKVKILQLKKNKIKKL